MNQLIEFFLENPLVFFSIGLILLPFAILVLRKIGHLTKLAGIYIRPKPRHAWAPSDQSPEQIAVYIKQKASYHDSKKPYLNRSINRLHWQIYMDLQALRRKLSRTPSAIISLVPASQWFFDNYNLLYKELNKLQMFGNLHKFRNMPVAKPVEESGYPRIYRIARDIVALSDYHLDEQVVLSMLDTYQTVRPIQARELWSLPDMIVLCLMEKTIEESKRVRQVIEIKRRADKVADRLAKLSEPDVAGFAAILEKAGSTGDLESMAFISHLYFRMKGMAFAESNLIEWISEILGLNQEKYSRKFYNLIETESEFEADAEATIRSLVSSLKTIGDIRWDEALQKVSVIDEILAGDPSGYYLKMNDQTRGLYRMTIEKLARQVHLSEIDVARQIANWSHEPPWPDLPEPSHIGTYLTGRGLARTKAALAGHDPEKKSKSGSGRRIYVIFYWVAILLLTSGLVAAGVLLAASGTPADQNGPSTGVLVLLGILLSLIGSSISMRLVQDISARLIKPKPQLSLDYLEDIPDEDRTFIVMPIIFSTTGQILDYIGRLEKQFLANRQNNLYFGLLADFQDAASESFPKDDDRIKVAEDAVHQLNLRYRGQSTQFYLMFRKRQWNEAENCWMGWERKRGKLQELNALLMGEDNKSFVIQVGDPDILRSFKYVITIDADTELMRDSAAALVGMMAHPLNRPRIDEQTMRINDGYAIAQPEIRTRMPGPSASLFARFFAGHIGIDPYGTVVSDIYQDLFNEGTFVGKGIYDIAVIHRLLGGNIPENSVLSHDLLEGSLSRCAFVSGVKLMDVNPSGIVSYIRREHRWIRGDWQLLPWLFRKSPINWLSKWKMIDNLRRSLLQTAALGLILISALALPWTPLLWLPYLSFYTAYNILKMIIQIVVQKNRNPSMRLAIVALRDQIVSCILKFLIEIVFIPVRGILALDAILRTLYRVGVSHQKLLQWQTADSVERSVQKKLAFHIRILWPAMLPAIPLFVGVIVNKAEPLWMAITLLMATLWAISPLIAWLISMKTRPRTPGKARRDQVSRLRVLARRTWNYFEDFASEKTNWLCPDNYQKYPGPKFSDKTSPTNIGLQLLSLLSARDLGFVGLHALVDNSEKLLQTIERLPKWHGHLFNWYQINSLDILAPEYVSTVDSGNFIAHLIAFRQGLLSFRVQPVFTDSNIRGLLDTLVAAGLGEVQQELEPSAHGSWKERLSSFMARLDELPTDKEWIRRIDKLCSDLLEDIESIKNFDGRLSICQLAEKNVEDAADLVTRIDNLAAHIDHLVHDTDFKVLYDRNHQLFMIGFHVSSQTADNGRYDLMASEARLTSFVAIAKGDVPQKHWFALGRPLTLIRGTPALLSWSGSMFEYLMPNLVLKTPPGSIFDQSCRAAVNRQISHGRHMKIPWGISESQYYAFDVQSNYQYTAFGVTRLRLQSTDRPAKVIAPYATMLALQVRSKAALANIDRLHRLPAAGDYGFYEALDFSRPDSSNLRDFSLVQSSMVHHLGMSLVAINNYLNHFIMQERFHKEPMIQASEPLLEETLAIGLVSVNRRWYTININTDEAREETAENRHVLSAGQPEPIAHVLANQAYMTFLTSDGEGFSSCEGVMINRWRPDPMCCGYGSFIYIRETESGRIWSNTWRPTRRDPDSYQVVFSPDKAEITRKDGKISTRTDVTLSPQKNLELRRVTLTNNGDKPVTIELTSYLEIVADDFRADSAHPAFSKLFIETEYDPVNHMLVARRRPRSPHDPVPMVMHRVVTETNLEQDVEFETDRRAFIGRNSNLDDPQILHANKPLSSRTGFTPDPIMSLRAVVKIPSGHSAVLVFLTGFARSREEITDMNIDYDRVHGSDNVFKNAVTASRLKMKYLSVNARQFNAIQDLTTALYYPSSTLRGPADPLLRNRLGQSSLWRFGISGDNPIMLLRVRDLKSAPLIKDVLLAFEVLRIHHVKVDLVIFNDETSGYAMELNHLIQGITNRLRVFNERPAAMGIHIVNRYQISSEEEDLLISVSRILFTPETGIYFKNKQTKILKEDKDQPVKQSKPSVIQLPPSAPEQDTVHIKPFPGKEAPLELFNGLGGFDKDGREYVIRIRSGMKTPGPWINVIANEKLGFLVSEAGAGYTWAGNSRENKLTPWSNDPVLDPASESIYVRDEDSGAITSPCIIGTVLNGHYQVRHGFGYSIFEHAELAISQKMTMFVCRDKPARIWLLNIENTGDQARSLTITLYVNWLLGVSRDQASPFVVTGFDRKNGCLYARNSYNELFKQQHAFIFSSDKITSWTGNRKEFLGGGGSARFPNGLTREEFSGEVGAGMDPCGVITIAVKLNPGENRSVVFGLGCANTADEMTSLAQAVRNPVDARNELEAVNEFWTNQLGGVVLQSPDRSLDILMNGWLRYQVLSCRIMARSAFYQAGGAYGFRDQLQDVLAFLDDDPDRVRSQILLCCSRQFREGDVQHWWHPPAGTGVRTRISDDLLWLPFVTAEYVESTGDTDILSVMAHWLEGEPLAEDQHEIMSTPQISDTADSVYQHCLKAIEQAARFGNNGLPLIGGGDWNDGMNRVGIEGRGESVWLGWFLYAVLHRFVNICKMQGDVKRSRQLASMAANLTGNLETAAWDGEWYLRAFFDNGDPMGSHHNNECRIDSISQSWAVLSDAADLKRAAQAVKSAREILVDDEYRTVALLAPPFDRPKNNPGYISGYYPGVRENGGQYTHAAIWLAMASARLNHSQEAWRILDLINPIRSTADLAKAYRYEKEPYVLAADICMAEPSRGRAGWSWYTGSASWMYQGILHDFLGLVRKNDTLFIDPCIPASWRTWHIDYCFGKSIYHLAFFNKNGPGLHVASITLDGQPVSGNKIALENDGTNHHAVIRLADEPLEDR